MAENVVRIAHHLAPEVAPNPLPLERGALDWVQGVVHGQEGRVHLGDVERRLVRTLVRALGQPVSTDALVAAGWPSRPASEHGLSVAVRRLRCKIEVDPAHPVHLRSVRGEGYLLQGAGELPASEPQTPAVVVRLTDGGIDLTAGVVHREGRSTALTATELALLRVLAETRVADRSALLSDVLGYRTTARTRALDAVVARLRKKLEPDPVRPVHLVTVRGRGLQLVPAPPPPGWPLGWTRALVGRDGDLAAVRRRLAGGTRLLTLTGPAGVGKSRLAREVAERMFGGALLAVDVADGDLVPTVAEALGIAGGGAVGATSARIALALASRGPVLLLLDNADPVVCAAPTVRAWLEQAPELQVLATSRERLGLDGEGLHEVLPLSPDDARALYLTRARELVPGLVLDDEADRALRTTLAELDHLPLAIELVAGTVDVRGLASVSADGASRHRSVHAAIAWSWDRLEPAVRSVLVQCAVFRAPFDPASAAIVTGAGPAVLAHLCRSHWLVAIQGRDGSPRFQLLRTLRRFVAPQDEAAVLAAGLRHTAWALARARRDLGDAIVSGPGEPDPDRWAELLAVLERAITLEERVDAVIGLRQRFEHHDLLALERTLDALAPEVHRLDPERRACLAILELHLRNDRLDRGPLAVEPILSLADDVDASSHPRVGAGLRFVLATALANEGRADDAARVAHQLVATSDPRHRGWGELVLGGIAFLGGELGAAHGHLERAAALFGAHGTATESAFGQNALSLAYREQGRLADARAALEQAMSLVSDAPIVYRARGNLGLLLLECQAPREAIEVLTASRDGARRRGASGDTLAPELGLAIAWMDLGDRRRVEQHLAAVELLPLPHGLDIECRVIRALAAYDQGDGETARVHLDAARAAPVHPTATTEAELAVAWIALADGDPAAAVEVARPAVERVARSGARLVEIQARATLATGLAVCGAIDEALAVMAPIRRFTAEPCRTTLLVDIAEAHLDRELGRTVAVSLRALASRSAVARILRPVVERLG